MFQYCIYIINVTVRKYEFIVKFNWNSVRYSDQTEDGSRCKIEDSTHIKCPDSAPGSLHVGAVIAVALVAGGVSVHLSQVLRQRVCV